ncbi:DUF6443 domain-containing protein [Flavobacterium sp. KACC 22758]|uniref:RHS repeat domain-containing protein n=1 Tax=Flavobacterium sp. KACC 22758 TaxID=3025667 RepID=UPI0023665287|nr:DUF6443 domain-containing protein [Flavobacterium sp. KACC 22758]WDF61882.1 DUF6443 domain-containing protein [Flavobacterium sp. KACC 22758]
MKKYLLILFLSFVYCFGAKSHREDSPVFNNNCISVQYPDFYQEILSRNLVTSNDSGDSAYGYIEISNNYLTVNFESVWSSNQSYVTGIVASINTTLPNIFLGPIYSGGQETGFFAKIEDNNLVVYSLTPNYSYFNRFNLGFSIDLSCMQNWYFDGDGDGFGNADSNPITDCYQPAWNYVPNNLDCNDQNHLVSAAKSWYLDADNDGYGDPGQGPVIQCDKPADNYVDNNLDLCPFEYGLSSNGCPDGTFYINENYMRTISPTIPVNTIEGLAATNKLDDIIYYDGLGRQMQKINIGGGGNGEDIVTPFEYDIYGKQTKEYLPYGKTTNGGIYMTNALESVQQFYNTVKYENSSNPYNEKQFEISPLNRVLKQASSGDSWKLGSGHEMKFEYQTNITGEVKMFNSVSTWNAAQNIYDISLSLSENVYYTAGDLYKNITKNENWTAGKNNTTEEFKDKKGRVVLKRTYADYKDNIGNIISSQKVHDTYYVYDIYGNLSYVLPPKAVDLLGSITNLQADIISMATVTSANPLHLKAGNSILLKADPNDPSKGFHAVAGSTFSAVIDTSTQTVLDDLCYQYKYDSRNRLVEKKMPGKEWEFSIYDKLDRVILTQDGNSRLQNKWFFTKYDAFERLVYTGEYTKLITRTALQGLADNSSVLYETKTQSTTINNTIVYYSNSAFPTDDIDLLTINYYDDYNFDIDGGTPENVGILAPSNQVKSLSTGSKIRVLGKPDWITNVIYYDNKGRDIYNYCKNSYLGAVHKVKKELDFVGKPTQTITEHVKEGTTLTVTDVFTYDSARRLKKQTQSLNGSAAEVICENFYDDVGQLIKKSVGGKNNQARYQNIDYTYNIRGWLKGINDSSTDNGAIALGTDDLFGFKINYNNPTDALKALYNGNISQTFWKMQNQNSDIKNYTYTYDALNRLTNAVSQDSGRYNESLTYDANGNIMSLIRNGYKDADALQAGIMDNLTYSYDNGNKLLKVDDSSGSMEGFKNGGNNGEDFSYDRNGNVKTDANKGITGITYNHLNLPVDITFSQGTIHYDYDALGTKLKKTVNDNGTVTVTQYVFDFQYEKLGSGINELKFFPHNEGYIKKTNGIYSYIYQYKDHLGNVRLSYENISLTVTPSLQIVEENNYYPFGLKQKVRGEVINQTVYKYKYNGKELQDELGLNFYDYGARNYDPALGRWMNIDPLAEKMRRYSPYNYAFNNPIFFIDPDGMAPSDIIFLSRNKDGSTKEELKYRNGNFYHNGGKGARYDPKEGNKTLNTVLSAFRKIEGSNDKVLKAGLFVLENSKQTHIIGEKMGNEKSNFVTTQFHEKDFENYQANEDVKNSKPVDTATFFDFSSEDKKNFERQEGVPDSDFTTVVHEMRHMFDYDRGKMADSVGKQHEKDPAEKRAVDFENRGRALINLPKRTTYGGLPFNLN